MHEGFSDVLPLPTPPLLSLWHGLSISASFLVQLNFPVCQLSILWWSFLVSQGSIWTQAQLFFSSLYAATLSVSGTAPVLSWNIWTGKKLLNRLTEMYLMLFNTQDGSCMEKLVTRVILAQSSTRTVLNWRICWPLLGTLSFSFHRFFSWVFFETVVPADSCRSPHFLLGSWTTRWIILFTHCIAVLSPQLNPSQKISAL